MRESATERKRDRATRETKTQRTNKSKQKQGPSSWTLNTFRTGVAGSHSAHAHNMRASVSYSSDSRPPAATNIVTCTMGFSMSREKETFKPAKIPGRACMPPKTTGGAPKPTQPPVYRSGLCNRGLQLPPARRGVQGVRLVQLDRFDAGGQRFLQQPREVQAVVPIHLTMRTMCINKRTSLYAYVNIWLWDKNRYPKWNPSK